MNVNLPSDRCEEFDKPAEAGKQIPAPAITKQTTHRPKNWFQIIESILDPKTLQIMMASGSGLLVIGLTIWLWTIGVFDHPVLAASLLGGINLAVLGLGVFLTKRWPKMMAGNAITLLACLVMPLNLWFYDAQGLIKLTEGGHLWIPGLICTMIYTGVARLLQDKTFVYTLVGGITLTGLLFLADMSVGRFWETTAPSAFLVVLGAICIHVERLFGTGEGPFKRGNFGKAFFQSGHVLLMGGLSLLLVGQLHGIFAFELFNFLNPETTVANPFGFKVVSLILVSLGSYCYFYSQAIFGKSLPFAGLAIATVLWAQLIAINLISVEITLQLVTAWLAAHAILAYGIGLLLVPAEGGANTNESGSRTSTVQSNAIWTGNLLSIITGIGCIAAVLFDYNLLDLHIENMSVVCCALTSIVALLGIISNVGTERNNFGLSQLYTFAVFASMTLLTLLNVFNVTQFELVLLALGAIPWLVRFGSHQLLNGSLRKHVLAIGDCSAIIMLSLVVACWIFSPATTLPATLAHVLMGLLSFSIAAYFATESEKGQNTSLNASLGLVALNIGIWRLLSPLDLGVTQYLTVSSLVGLSGLIVDRVYGSGTDKKNATTLATLSHYGIAFSGVGSILFAVSQILGGGAVLSLAGMMLVQAGIAFVASRFVDSADGRLGYYQLAGFEILVSLSIIGLLSSLGFYDRIELLTTIGGIALLVAGHLTWFRENDKNADFVSFALGLGSILTAAPILTGLLSHRTMELNVTGGWIMLHEVGVLAIGILLLGSGVLLKIRTTTLAGAASLAIYIATLLMLIQLPDRLQTTSAYMMIGGGAFFTISILLSIYRERLLKLPEKIRDGEGVFQVLKWR